MNNTHSPAAANQDISIVTERDAKTRPDGSSKPKKVGGKLRRALMVLVTQGGTITDAANATGIARESLSRALQKPHVLQELDALRRLHYSVRGAQAGKVIEHLMKNARSEYVRLEAAKDTLDRAGDTKSVTGGGTPTAVQINIDLSGKV